MFLLGMFPLESDGDDVQCGETFFASSAETINRPEKAAYWLDFLSQ